MENASLMVTALSMLGGVLGFVVSTFFVLMQMQSADKWNKKKTSEELLTQIMTGEFPKLMDSLVLEYNWDALAHVPYAQRARELDEPELRKLDAVLRNVLRHLEVVCINMKHQIIDEKVCYEYLHSIPTTFYETCSDFIAKERTRRQEPRVYRVGGVRQKMATYPRKIITARLGGEVVGPAGLEPATTPL